MNPPTLHSRTRHSYPPLERRPRKFTVGLPAIIRIAISGIQFRFDEMTARHRLAIERLPRIAQRDPRAEQVRPENRELARGQTETSPSGWRSLHRRRDRLVSALRAIAHGSRLHTRIRYPLGPEGAVEALQEFVNNFTYLGIFAVLLLGSLGVPIPEEMAIIAAAVLSHEGIARWWIAVPVCLLGVLSGDMVLYWVGRHWGELVLNWRLVRLVLSPAREQWLKAAYRRHALKTVVTARHVMGLRAAAFLTAGSASVPFWKFAVADTGAAFFGVPLLFGLAYFFTDQIKAIMVDVHRTERWLGLAGLLVLAAMLVVGVWRWHRRVGQERLDEELGRGTFAAALSARDGDLSSVRTASERAHSSVAVGE